MGIGVIIKDNMRQVMAFLSAPRDFIIAPDIVEATAVLKALILTWDLGFIKIVLEGNTFQVVQALRKDGLNWCRYGHMIEKARGMMSCMHSWHVNHVRRQFNGAAHGLAKVALFLSEEHVLLQQVPTCICKIVYLKHCT